MEFVAEKLNSFTGNALSGINEMRRQKQQQQQDQPQQVDGAGNVEVGAKSSAITNTSSNNNPQELRQRPALAPPQPQSAPFGGDTIFSHQPRPIGWYLNEPLSSQSVAEGGDSKGAGNWPQPVAAAIQPGGCLDEKRRQLAASDPALYEGDAWSKLWFQRLMILSLIRLFVFIRKVYEDYSATKTYRNQGQWGHLLVSMAALLLPTAVFTIYRVSRYLQIALPAARVMSAKASLYPGDAGSRGQRLAIAARPNKLDDGAKNDNKRPMASGGDDEESQVRKALMESGSPTPQNDEDGLVTARQSPTNVEEFHDSRSVYQPTTTSKTNIGPHEVDGGTVSPAPSTARIKDSPLHQKQQSDAAFVAEVIKESVDIDKLGNIPDKENARIVIGACEQLLHGALFVFWQLKRQVDVMGYLVDRSCLWRKPRGVEKEELDKLRTGSDGLEWFQDFYAAFLAILAQVYTLGLYWTSHDNFNKQPIVKENVAVSSVVGMDKLESSISSGGRVVSEMGKGVFAGINPVDGRDLLIMSELVVSSAVVFSLLIAVRRRDDGPLSLVLSMLGWGSIFASRIIVVALAFVHIGWKIMLPLVACHVFGITAWIYKIAIDSHNGKPSETEELRWATEDDELPQSSSSPNDTNQSIELNTSSGGGSTSKQETTTTTAQPDDPSESACAVTSQWSVLEHVVLISQIFTLFALPSLFYWPIMFNLKLHYRPFKYLVLILSENFILIPAIWFSISSMATLGQWYLLGAVGGFSIVGFILVSLYVACKPSLTEYFARADELYNAAEKAGIYFEFCSRVFKMPDLGKHAFQRLMNQYEVVEGEIEVIDV